MGKIYDPEIVTSGFQTTNTLNQNFLAIEEALDKCLVRTGETPNDMEADLDLNNNDLLNVKDLHAENVVVGALDLGDLLSSFSNDMDEKVQDASDFADSASQSAIGAATQAGIALSHSQDAAQHASDALGYSQAAAQSASDAQDAVDSLDLPTISPGDAGRTLRVKGDETGYETGHILPTTGTVDGGRVVVASSSESNAFSLSVAATPSNTPSTIVSRDSAGRFSAEDPTSSTQVATKGYVDNEISLLPTSLLPIPTTGDAGKAVVVNQGEDGFVFSERAIRADGQTFTSGTGRDFPTLQDAIDHVVGTYSRRESAATGEIVIDVYSGSGTAQIRGIRDVNLGLRLHTTHGDTWGLSIWDSSIKIYVAEASYTSAYHVLAYDSDIAVLADANASLPLGIAAQFHRCRVHIGEYGGGYGNRAVVTTGSYVSLTDCTGVVENLEPPGQSVLPFINVTGGAITVDNVLGTSTTAAAPLIKATGASVNIVSSNYVGTGNHVELYQGAVVSAVHTKTSNVTKNTISANGILMCP